MDRHLFAHRDRVGGLDLKVRREPEREYVEWTVSVPDDVALATVLWVVTRPQVAGARGTGVLPRGAHAAVGERHVLPRHEAFVQNLVLFAVDFGRFE